MSARGHMSGNGSSAAMHAEFMAFAGDDDSLTILREWAHRQGFPAATVQQGGPDLFAQMLESAAPPNMVIVDIDFQADAIGMITRLVNLCGAECKIVGLGSANDVMLYRQMLGAGAVDYLVKPLASDSLNQAMAAALKSSREVNKVAKEAKTVIVMGTRGGIGASTIAVNLGWLMAEESKLNIALLDLDLQFGVTSLALDLEPGHGLRDILSSPQRVDGLMIASSMAEASSRFSVLAAEESVDDVLDVDNAAITALLHEMKSNFDYVLVDLPRHMFAMQKRLLTVASDIILVTELSLAGIRDTLRLKTALKNLDCASNVIIVGARTNAVRAGHVDVAAFEKGAQTKIDIIVPEDIKAIAMAANQGKALGAVARNAPITKALMTLAARIHRPTGTMANQGGLLGKFFGKGKAKSDKSHAGKTKGT